MQAPDLGTCNDVTTAVSVKNQFKFKRSIIIGLGFVQLLQAVPTAHASVNWPLQIGAST
jgi:hypothetical protein